MEKELFLTTLKSKSGVDNLSERTINEVATLFLPQFADDEKITDESWNLPVQMLKSMSGQLRHDTSEGINAFKTKFEAENKAANEKAIADAIAAAKAEWEKTRQEPDPGKTEPDIDTKVANAVAEAMKGITGDDGAIGKLSKELSDFIAQAAAEKKALTEEGIRTSVRDYLIGRGADEDDFALEYTLEKLEIGDKPDLSALRNKAEKDYEANYKRIHKEGGKPFGGGAGGEGGSAADSIKNWAKEAQTRIEEEAKAAAELGKHIFK